MAKKIREAKPAPIRSRRDSGVASLDWGHNHEDQACESFWLRHPEYDMHNEHWCYWHDPRQKVFYTLCGTSPDRTLYKNMIRVSGLEAKCPYDEDIFRRYWSEERCPPEYMPQIYWHMIVTGLDYWWFVAFDPRAPESHQYYELRVELDMAYASELMAKVNRFIGGYLAGETFKPTLFNRTTYEEIF